MSAVPEPAGAPSGTSLGVDHRDFTQELPRKLLPTNAKEAQRRRGETR
jgi:hypothetical protein